MKKILILLTVLTLAIMRTPAWAEKSTSNEEWQQRKEDLKPSELKELIEENHQLKFGNQRLTKEITRGQQELEKLLRLKTKIEALRKENGYNTPGNNDDYSDLEALFSSKQPQKIVSIDGFTQDDWALDENGKSYIKGVVFKVQIGAYKKRNLSNVLENNHSQEIFEQEQKGDLNRYTLRHFRNYQKANEFKKQIRKMGLKDAWIVPFNNGKRVPLSTVLNTVFKKK